MIKPGSVVQTRMNFTPLGAVMNGRPVEGFAGSVDIRQPMLVMSVVKLPEAWRLDVVNCDWLVVLIGPRMHMGWLYDYEVVSSSA